MVQFTRSRPYHKNDNAHVEQKNWTHVRHLFGYDRIDKKELIVLMNDLYNKEWSLLQNHFCPSLKLLEKTKINSKYRKKYGTPKTPYHRVLESPYVIDKEKKRLITKHKSLNPFKLKRDIEKKLKQIFKHVQITTNVRLRL